MKQTRIIPRQTVIDGIRAVEARSDHVFSRHSHDEFGLGLMRAGAQRSSSGRGQVEAGPGDMITVNPAEVHCGEPLSGVPRTWWMLYWDPDVIHRLTRDETGETVDRCEFRAPVLPSHAGRALFGRLYGALTSSVPLHDEGLLEEGLMRLLVPLFVAKQPGASPPPLIKTVIEAIEDDPARTICLAELATLVGLTRFQLIRQFTKTTGLTPHAFQTQRRLNRARRLILSGRPLSEAATASGFYDQSHMNRWFNRAYGTTPGAFAPSPA